MRRVRAWLDVIDPEDLPDGSAPPAGGRLTWDCVLETDHEEESDERTGDFAVLLDWALAAGADELWVWSPTRGTFERRSPSDRSDLHALHGT